MRYIRHIIVTLYSNQRRIDMNKSIKTAAIFTSSLLLLLCLSIPTASAQQTVVVGDTDTYVLDKEPLDQARLDQTLAPIALYPDSLLSQILVAATYPLEVVQATRWRQANRSLTEKQVLAAIEDKRWDPSVKALTPFTDLLSRLSKDLDWLQQLGDAFLQNEEQVLASIQDLRQKAHDNGSIADNDYYDVVEEDNNIIIKSTSREIVYVPYYDSRVVYGPWGWNDYQPVYWHRPSHYRHHAGFYWSDRFYIRPTIFFGGFHWGSRNLVVNHHFYDRPYRNNTRYRNVRVSDYRNWNHNPVHRRGARYSRNGGNRYVHRNQYNSHSRANRETRQHRRERRHESNRAVSGNPRNSENIRITQRNRVQQRNQETRRNDRRAERRDRVDFAERSQRSNPRTQKPTRRNTNTAVTEHRGEVRNGRTRQHSASLPRHAKPNGNRPKPRMQSVNKAPVVNNPPKRNVVTRQNNPRKVENKPINSRSSERKSEKHKLRHQARNKPSNSNRRPR